MRKNLSLIVIVLSLLFSRALLATETPYTGGPYAIPGVIQAENYDFGLEGEAYHDTSPGNAFGVYRGDSMDVGPITAGGYFIGNLANGEWAKYTVNVAAAGNYNLTYRYSSNTTLVTSFRVLLNGTVLATRSVTSTGDWQNFVTQTVQVNIPSTATGSKILMLAFDTGAFNLDSLQFAQVTTCTAPTISAPADQTVNAGSTITWSLSVGGSPAPVVKWYKGTLQSNQQLTAPNPLMFQLTNVEQGKDAGTYFATATNSCGTATTRLATVYVPCDGTSPDEMLENVSRALHGTGDRCDWRGQVTSNFGSTFVSGSNGSYNLPLLANTVAFISAPHGTGSYTWDMDASLTRYLQGEVGDRGTAWFYGGEELLSSDYGKYNEAAILAIHYQAYKTNKVAIRDLARRWLKATLALHAAGAAAHEPAVLHADSQSLNVTDSWTGPYIALGGERTPWGFWTDPGRNTMLANAIGLATSNAERAEQRNVRQYLQSQWVGFSPPAPCTTSSGFQCNTNVYGLTNAETGELRNAIAANVLPATFVSNYLGSGLRTVNTYHIVAWPNVRASLMEANNHNSTAPTFGFATFGADAYFLYPWPGVFGPDTSIYRNTCNGTATLDLASGQMTAQHPDCKKQPAQQSAIFGLPTTGRSYWVTLTKTAPPLVH